MYCYSFVLVNRENQESLDNYKRSICVSFSACLGNGVPSPLHWPTPAELVLFNNTLLMKNWEKDPTFTTYIPSTWNSELFFCDFLNGYMFDLRFSWTDFLWTSITEHYKSNVSYDIDVMYFLSSCVFRWKMSCSHQKILIAMAFLYNLLKLSCPWNL